MAAEAYASVFKQRCDVFFQKTSNGCIFVLFIEGEGVRGDGYLRIAHQGDQTPLPACLAGSQRRDIAIYYGKWRLPSSRQPRGSGPTQAHPAGSGIPSHANNGTGSLNPSLLNAHAPIFTPALVTQTTLAPVLAQNPAVASTILGQSSTPVDASGAGAVAPSLDADAVEVAVSIEASQVEARADPVQDTHQSQLYNDESRSEATHSRSSPNFQEDTDKQAADAEAHSPTTNSFTSSLDSHQERGLSSRTSLDVIDGSIPSSTAQSTGSYSKKEPIEERRSRQDSVRYCESSLWRKPLNQINTLPRKFQSGQHSQHCKCVSCRLSSNEKSQSSAREGFQALDDNCRNAQHCELLQGSEVEPRSPNGKLVSDGSFGAIGGPVKQASACVPKTDSLTDIQKVRKGFRWPCHFPLILNPRFAT